MVSTSRNKIFSKHWSPSNGNNGFQENMNERISFPSNRKSVATGRNKGFIYYVFSRDGETASSKKDICEIGRKSFPPAGKSVSTSKNKGFVIKMNLH